MSAAVYSPVWAHGQGRRACPRNVRDMCRGDIALVVCNAFRKRGQYRRTYGGQGLQCARKKDKCQRSHPDCKAVPEACITFICKSLREFSSFPSRL